jgi:hypothetical protein
VVSNLEVQHLQLSRSYQFIHLREGKFRLGPVTELNGFLMGGTLAAPDLVTPFHETEDLKSGIPTVGVAMDIQARRNIDIYGQVSGCAGPLSGPDSRSKKEHWPQATILLRPSCRVVH